MVNISTFKQVRGITKPRRLLRYLLIWCAKGKATLVLDDKELTLRQREVVTVTSGQIHYFKDITTAEGVILDFSLDFFSKDDADLELVFHNGLFCHFDLNEVITVKEYTIIENELKEIARELRARPYQYLHSVHARIQLILIHINRAKVQRGDEIYKPDALFLKFLELVRGNFELNYPLSHFARLLSTTPAKINEQAKLHTGRTAQMVIHGLVVAEAKRLMMYENLSVKEVAYRLGFKDPFYFSNFFKKHTGYSPTAFHDKHAI
ncbi:MAG: helix-turn-helix domain-containing protein [Cyclobacteriaceae bacterium]|nr:helix-turn-helix domain-containing protein [Cyclobacteriaceae bacterium]UYN87263.1 MAG: helix-turn-helix domain-containing protein [Cyclobacteriaceae bacterium]